MNDFKLIASGVELEVSEEIPFPISYSVADIKDPANRKRSGSKTVVLPGCQKNNLFFSSTYQLSLADFEANSVSGFNFDPTQRVEVQAYKNGTKVFDGLLQLIEVKFSKGVPSYSVTLFSNFVDVFQQLGDRTISELGWSEYDHELSISNIVNSWDTSVIKNGAPVSNFTAGVPDGFGYVYNYSYYGYSANPLDCLTNSIFPHVYYKELIEKCLAVSGFSVGGNFISSKRLRRMVLGFEGGPKKTIGAAELANRRCEYGISGNYSGDYYKTGQTFVNNDPFFGSGYRYFYSYNDRQVIRNDWATLTLVADNFSQFDTSTGELTILKSGKYNFNFSSEFDIQANLTGTGTRLTNNYSFLVRLYKNGAVIATIYNGLVPFSPSPTTLTIDETISVDVASGDRLSIEYIFSMTNATVFSTEPPASAPYFTFDLNNVVSASFALTSIQAPLVDGDTVSVAAFLPEMKASEFLKGVITQFNLYIDDPDPDGVVRIEPLEDYYSNTDEFEDWTQLLDESKEVKILPAYSIKGKTYSFKYAEEEDFYHKQHHEKHGFRYGDMNYNVPSTYQKGTVEFKLPFSIGIPVQIPGKNIFIPYIINVDPATGAVSPYKGKARVYYYQGIRSSDSWALRNSADLVTVQTLTYYPAFGHIDNYDAATFDICFGPVAELYYPATSYTPNNIFTEYIEKFVRESTGKDSKILKAYFKLNESSVSPEKFRILKMIKGVLFRLNEIENFDPNNNSTTTMAELIRVVSADKRRQVTFTPSGLIGAKPLQTGGNDTNGGDSGVILITGEKDIVETTSPAYFGEKF